MGPFSTLLLVAVLVTGASGRDVSYGADDVNGRCRVDVCDVAHQAAASAHYVKYQNSYLSDDRGFDRISSGLGYRNNDKHLYNDQDTTVEKFRKAVVRPVIQGQHEFTYTAYDKCHNVIGTAKATIDARCAFDLKATAEAAPTVSMKTGGEIFIDGRGTKSFLSGAISKQTGETSTFYATDVVATHAKAELEYHWCLTKVPAGSVYTSRLAIGGNAVDDGGARLRTAKLNVDGEVAADTRSKNVAFLRPDKAGDYTVQLTVTVKKLDGVSIYAAASQYTKDQVVFDNTKKKCFKARRDTKAGGLVAGQTTGAAPTDRPSDKNWVAVVCPAYVNSFAECSSTTSVNVKVALSCCSTSVDILPIPSLEESSVAEVYLHGAASLAGKTWCLPADYPPSALEIGQRSKRYSPVGVGGSVISNSLYAGFYSVMNKGTHTAGCTWPGASNFKEAATFDDGSCVCNSDRTVNSAASLDGTKTYADTRTTLDLGAKALTFLGVTTDGVANTNDAALNNYGVTWSVAPRAATLGKAYVGAASWKDQFVQGTAKGFSGTMYKVYSGAVKDKIPHYHPLSASRDQQCAVAGCTAQADGGGVQEFKLEAGASTVSGYYAGCKIRIVNVNGGGCAKATYVVDAYNGATKVCTVSEGKLLTGAFVKETDGNCGNAKYQMDCGDIVWAGADKTAPTKCWKSQYVDENVQASHDLTNTDTVSTWWRLTKGVVGGEQGGAQAAGGCPLTKNRDTPIFDIETTYAAGDVVFFPKDEKCYESLKAGNLHHLDEEVTKNDLTLDYTRNKWVIIPCPAVTAVEYLDLATSVDAAVADSNDAGATNSATETIQRKPHRLCHPGSLSSHTLDITLGIETRRIVKSQTTTITRRNYANVDRLLCTVELTGLSDLIGQFSRDVAVAAGETTDSSIVYSDLAHDVPNKGGRVGAYAFGTANTRQYYYQMFAKKGRHFRFTATAGSTNQLPKLTVTAAAPAGCTGTYDLTVDLHRDDTVTVWSETVSYSAGEIVQDTTEPTDTQENGYQYRCFRSLVDFNLDKQPGWKDGYTHPNVGTNWALLATCAGRQVGECNVPRDTKATTQTCDVVPRVVAGLDLSAADLIKTNNHLSTGEKLNSYRTASLNGLTDTGNWRVPKTVAAGVGQAAVWSAANYYRVGDIVYKSSVLYRAIRSSLAKDAALATFDRSEGVLYNLNRNPDDTSSRLFWAKMGPASDTTANSMMDGRQAPDQMHATNGKITTTRAHVNVQYEDATSYARGQIVRRTPMTYEALGNSPVLGSIFMTGVGTGKCYEVAKQIRTGGNEIDDLVTDASANILTITMDAGSTLTSFVDNSVSANTPSTFMIYVPQAVTDAESADTDASTKAGHGVDNRITTYIRGKTFSVETISANGREITVKAPGLPVGGLVNYNTGVDRMRIIVPGAYIDYNQKTTHQTGMIVKDNKKCYRALKVVPAAVKVVDVKVALYDLDGLAQPLATTKGATFYTQNNLAPKAFIAGTAGAKGVAATNDAISTVVADGHGFAAGDKISIFGTGGGTSGLVDRTFTLAASNAASNTFTLDVAALGAAGAGGKTDTLEQNWASTDATAAISLLDANYWQSVDCVTGVAAFVPTACDSVCFRALTKTTANNDPYSDVSSTSDGATSNKEDRHFDNKATQVAATTTNTQWARTECDSMPTMYFNPGDETFGQVKLLSDKDLADTGFGPLTGGEASWRVKGFVGPPAAKAMLNFAYPGKEIAAAGTTPLPFDTDTDWNTAVTTAQTVVSRMGECYQFTGQYDQNVRGVQSSVTGARAGGSVKVQEFVYDAANPHKSDWAKISCDGSFTEARYNNFAGLALATGRTPFPITRGDTTVVASGTKAWTSGAAMKMGDVVFYGGVCYRAKKDSTGEVPAKEPTTAGTARAANQGINVDFWEKGAGVTCSFDVTRTPALMNNEPLINFAAWPFKIAAGSGGKTDTGMQTKVDEAAIDYTDEATTPTLMPNPYFNAPFSGAAGAMEFRPSNEGIYTLEVSYMGRCGVSTDEIQVRARCLPLEAQPSLFLLSTHGTGGRGYGTGGNKLSQGAGKRGTRDVDLGFTPDSPNLGVSTYTGGVNGRGSVRVGLTISDGGTAGKTDVKLDHGGYAANDLVNCWVSLRSSAALANTDCKTTTPIKVTASDADANNVLLTLASDVPEGGAGGAVPTDCATATKYVVDCTTDGGFEDSGVPDDYKTGAGNAQGVKTVGFDVNQYDLKAGPTASLFAAKQTGTTAIAQAQSMTSRVGRVGYQNGLVTDMTAGEGASKIADSLFDIDTQAPATGGSVAAKAAAGASVFCFLGVMTSVTYPQVPTTNKGFAANAGDFATYGKVTLTHRAAAARTTAGLATYLLRAGVRFPEGYAIDSTGTTAVNGVAGFDTNAAKVGFKWEVTSPTAETSVHNAANFYHMETAECKAIQGTHGIAAAPTDRERTLRFSRAGQYKFKLHVWDACTKHTAQEIMVEVVCDEFTTAAAICGIADKLRSTSTPQQVEKCAGITVRSSCIADAKCAWFPKVSKVSNVHMGGFPESISPSTLMVTGAGTAVGTNLNLITGLTAGFWAEGAKFSQGPLGKLALDSTARTAQMEAVVQRTVGTSALATSTAAYVKMSVSHAFDIDNVANAQYFVTHANTNDVVLLEGHKIVQYQQRIELSTAVARSVTVGEILTQTTRGASGIILESAPTHQFVRVLLTSTKSFVDEAILKGGAAWDTPGGKGLNNPQEYAVGTVVVSTNQGSKKKILVTMTSATKPTTEQALSTAVTSQVFHPSGRLFALAGAGGTSGAAIPLKDNLIDASTATDVPGATTVDLGGVTGGVTGLVYHTGGAVTVTEGFAGTYRTMLMADNLVYTVGQKLTQHTTDVGLTLRSTGATGIFDAPAANSPAVGVYLIQVGTGAMCKTTSFVTIGSINNADLDIALGTCRMLTLASFDGTQVTVDTNGNGVVDGGETTVLAVKSNAVPSRTADASPWVGTVAVSTGGAVTSVVVRVTSGAAVFDPNSPVSCMQDISATQCAAGEGFQTAKSTKTAFMQLSHYWGVNLKATTAGANYLPGNTLTFPCSALGAPMGDGTAQKNAVLTIGSGSTQSEAAAGLRNVDGSLSDGGLNLAACDYIPVGTGATVVPVHLITNAIGTAAAGTTVGSGAALTFNTLAMDTAITGQRLGDTNKASVDGTIHEYYGTTANAASKWDTVHETAIDIYWNDAANADAGGLYTDSERKFPKVFIFAAPDDDATRETANADKRKVLGRMEDDYQYSTADYDLKKGDDGFGAQDVGGSSPMGMNSKTHNFFRWILRDQEANFPTTNVAYVDDREACTDHRTVATEWNFGPRFDKCTAAADFAGGQNQPCLNNHMKSFQPTKPGVYIVDAVWSNGCDHKVTTFTITARCNSAPTIRASGTNPAGTAASSTVVAVPGGRAGSSAANQPIVEIDATPWCWMKTCVTLTFVTGGGGKGSATAGEALVQHIPDPTTVEFWSTGALNGAPVIQGGKTVKQFAVDGTQTAEGVTLATDPAAGKYPAGKMFVRVTWGTFVVDENVAGVQNTIYDTAGAELPVVVTAAADGTAAGKALGVQQAGATPFTSWSRAGYKASTNDGFDDIKFDFRGRFQAWTSSEYPRGSTAEFEDGLTYSLYIYACGATSPAVPCNADKAQRTLVASYQYGSTDNTDQTTGSAVPAGSITAANTVTTNANILLRHDSSHAFSKLTWPKLKIRTAVTETKTDTFTWEVVVTDGCPGQAPATETGVVRAVCDTDPSLSNFAKDAKTGSAMTLNWLNRKERFGTESTLVRWYVSKQETGAGGETQGACPAAFGKLAAMSDRRVDADYADYVYNLAGLEPQQSFKAGQIATQVQNHQQITFSVSQTWKRGEVFQQSRLHLITTNDGAALFTGQAYVYGTVTKDTTGTAVTVAVKNYKLAPVLASIVDVTATAGGTAGGGGGNVVTGDVFTFPCSELGSTGGTAYITLVAGDHTAGVLKVVGNELRASTDVSNCEGPFTGSLTDKAITPTFLAIPGGANTPNPAVAIKVSTLPTGFVAQGSGVTTTASSHDHRVVKNGIFRTGAAGSAALALDASTVDGTYVGCTLRVLTGGCNSDETGIAVGAASRLITAYVGATRRAAVAAANADCNGGKYSLECSAMGIPTAVGAVAAVKVEGTVEMDTDNGETAQGTDDTTRVKTTNVRLTSTKGASPGATVGFNMFDPVQLSQPASPRYDAYNRILPTDYAAANSRVVSLAVAGAFGKKTASNAGATYTTTALDNGANNAWNKLRFTNVPAATVNYYVGCKITVIAGACAAGAYTIVDSTANGAGAASTLTVVPWFQVQDCSTTTDFFMTCPAEYDPNTVVQAQTYLTFTTVALTIPLKKYMKVTNGGAIGFVRADAAQGATEFSVYDTRAADWSTAANLVIRVAGFSGSTQTAVTINAADFTAAVMTEDWKTGTVIKSTGQTQGATDEGAYAYLVGATLDWFLSTLHTNFQLRGGAKSATAFKPFQNQNTNGVKAGAAPAGASALFLQFSTPADGAVAAHSAPGPAEAWASNDILHIDGLDFGTGTSSKFLTFTYHLGASDPEALASLGAVVTDKANRAKLIKHQSGLMSLVSNGVTQVAANSIRGTPTAAQRYVNTDLQGASDGVETHPGSVTYYETSEYFAYAAEGTGTNSEGDGGFKITPYYGKAGTGSKYTLTFKVTDGCQTKTWSRDILARCPSLSASITTGTATAAFTLTAATLAADRTSSPLKLGYQEGTQLNHGQFSKVGLAATSAGAEATYRWTFVEAPAGSVFSKAGLYHAYGFPYVQTENAGRPGNKGQIGTTTPTATGIASMASAHEEVRRSATAPSSDNGNTLTEVYQRRIDDQSVLGVVTKATLVSTSSDGEVTWFRPDVPGTYKLSLEVDDGCSVADSGATVMTVTADCFPAPSMSAVTVEAAGAAVVEDTGKFPVPYSGATGFVGGVKMVAGATPALSTEDMPFIGYNYTWTKVAVPAGSNVFDVANALSGEVSFTPDAVGDYSFEVCVDAAHFEGGACTVPFCKAAAATACKTVTVAVTCAAATGAVTASAVTDKYQLESTAGAKFIYGQHLTFQQEATGAGGQVLTPPSSSMTVLKSLNAGTGGGLSGAIAGITANSYTFPKVSLAGSAPDACHEHKWEMTKHTCSSPYTLSVAAVDSVPCYGGDVWVRGSGFKPAGVSKDQIMVKLVHKARGGTDINSAPPNQYVNNAQASYDWRDVEDWDAGRLYRVGEMARVAKAGECYRARADPNLHQHAGYQSEADLKKLIFEMWEKVACPASAAADPSKNAGEGTYQMIDSAVANRLHPVGAVVMLDVDYCVKATRAQRGMQPLIVASGVSAPTWLSSWEAATTDDGRCNQISNAAPSGAASFSFCRVKSFNNTHVRCRMPAFKAPDSYTDIQYELASQKMFVEVEVMGIRAASSTGIFSYERGLTVSKVEIAGAAAGAPLTSPTVGGGILVITGKNFRAAEYSGAWSPSTGYAPFLVTIGDGVCRTLSQTETQIKCQIPAGYGTHHMVKISQAQKIVYKKTWRDSKLDRAKATAGMEDTADQVYTARAAQDGPGVTEAAPNIELRHSGSWNTADYYAGCRVKYNAGTCAGTTFDILSHNVLGIAIVNPPASADCGANGYTMTCPGDGKVNPLSDALTAQVGTALRCMSNTLLRATPCGIFGCACAADWRSQKQAGALAVFHYTEPQVIEIGKTYNALASTSGGQQYNDVRASINGEMGAVSRGATEPVPRQATGLPTGGEWIEISARNLPPVTNLKAMMQAGTFYFVFGRLFDYENVGSANIGATNDHQFGAEGDAAAADHKAFTYDGTVTDNSVYATAGDVVGGAAGGNVHGGTTKGFGTVQRKACMTEDLVLMEVESATRPARFMCRTPPGCDVVHVNAHMDARTGINEADLPCVGQPTQQVSCQDVKFKYVEPYICDWYEASCGTIALVGRNMPGTSIVDSQQPHALDVEVVLQEYDHMTNAWSDRAPCQNLQRSIVETGETTDDREAGAKRGGDNLADGLNSNVKPVMNDDRTVPLFDSVQAAAVAAGYTVWLKTTNYVLGATVFHGQACWNADADPSAGEEPTTQIHSTGDLNRYPWNQVTCPSVGSQANVLRPDFTCRLPAVFWARNAAKSWDSAIHKSFRFKVRGCFLHEASFYSAAGEQRTCKVGEPAMALGYNATAMKMSMAALPVAAADSKTRVILGEMWISATSGYLEVGHFGNSERAKVLAVMNQQLGLKPNQILLETIAQSGNMVKVEVAFVTDEARSMALTTALTGTDLDAALQNAVNTLGGKAVKGFQFSKVRDMLQYDGAKRMLSGSVKVSGVNPANVISSSTFRDSMRASIAQKTGVPVSAVQITSVKQVTTSGRRTRRLLQDDAASTTVEVSFTVVTDASSTSLTSAENLAAKLQEAVNDGTLVKDINSKTGLAFTGATLGTTTGAGAVAASGTDFQAWAIAVTVIMAVLLIVIVIFVVATCGKGRGAGAPASSSLDASGGVALGEVSNSKVAGAQSGLMSNPGFKTGAEQKQR